jgi:hypothetical protein
MNTFGIAKIDQSKLREEVYSALHDAFTRGEFAQVRYLTYAVWLSSWARP